jgi:hypothetical protein
MNVFCPPLTISVLRYYGSVVDEVRQHYWLFLEDAGDVPYVRELKEHRNLAAYWSATMHGSAPRVPSIEGLAVRAGTFYLNLFRETRESTLEIIDHPILGGCDPTPYGQKTETAEKPVSLAASVAVSEAAQ